MSGGTIGRAGSGTTSRALGANDPRHRRNAQASLVERNRIGDSLEIDSRQRLTVKPAIGVSALSALPGAPTSQEVTDKVNELTDKVNELLARLAEAKLMEAN